MPAKAGAWERGSDKNLKKRQKSLSLSIELLEKLDRLYEDEMRRRFNTREERISFSEFVEGLLRKAIKLTN